MSKFDADKLKKKIKKQTKKAGKVKIKTNSTGGFYFVGFVGAVIYLI
jgi:hypothetical protein